MIINATVSIQKGDDITAEVRKTETVEQHIALGIGRDLTIFINDKDQALDLIGAILDAVVSWEVEV